MRRFEFTDDKSAKFWEIEQADTDLNIRWGRIGTAGQSQTKNFSDAGKAAAAMQKLVSEKTGKGYSETGAGTVSATAEAGAAEVKVKVKTAKAAQASKAATKKTDAQHAPAENIETAAAPQQSVVTESLDAQMARAYGDICLQIAEARLVLNESGLTPARIRRIFNISELAANQVSKQLSSSGLLNYWSHELTPNAQKIAVELVAEEAAIASAAPSTATVVNTDGLAPWLAAGEPLNLATAKTMGLDVHKLAYATRSHPKPVSQVDAQKSWLEIRRTILAGRESDISGSDAGLRASFEAAWKTLDNLKLGGDLHTDAVLFSICVNQRISSHADLGPLLINYLVARHGLPYAMDTVLLASQGMEAVEEYVRNGKNKIRLRQNVQFPWLGSYYGCLSLGEICLRNHLSAASQEEYDLCVDKVRQALPGIPAVRQPGLALLFSDSPELTHSIIHELCGEGKKPPSTVHWLQLTATDPLALSMTRKIKTDGYSNLWNDKEVVCTLLMIHGVQATSWLAPGASLEEAGGALTCIGTPDALEALARVASSSKDALARFVLAVNRWPAAAITALAGLLSGNSKDQGLLMPTLIEQLRASPDLVNALQARLEPAGRALITKLQGRLAGPADIATVEDLPSVLANPPWLQAKKKAAQVLQLKPLPLAATEYWMEGEKERALTLYEWYRDRYQAAAKDPHIMAVELTGSRGDKLTSGVKKLAAAIKSLDLPAIVDSWRAAIEEKKKERYYYFSLDAQAVSHLPPEIAIPFWNKNASEVSCDSVEHIAAKWGLAVLPGVLAKIQSAPTENFDVALHFGAIELAPIAARAYAKLKTFRGMGRQWLKRYPEHAACGLIATALGKPSEARDCAASALRWLAANGHAALLDEVAGRYAQPEVLTAMHAMLNESPLDRYPAKRPALPEFWRPGGWNRPLLHNGKALSDATLEALGSMMMFPTNEEIYAGLPQVKAACTPQSLADFTWDCFSAWLNAGAPSKEGWALTVLGLLGNDETARLLTPYIRAWPGESAHARAVTGLDVLANIGTDVPLMLLNGIAQKVKFKGLQDKAREKISSIAEARGLTPEELEDRLAPDLGLDEQGSMVLDFGPRSYKVGFDESLKPYVREWLDGKAGARLPDLPKPKKTDDEVLAKEATERFKLLKKDARTIASQQVLRLEVAMCMRRRWAPEVFAQFLATHPLVRHLVRRLVWAVYLMPETVSGEGEDQETTIASYGGELQSCFRVSEDGEYTTAQDDSFVLPEGERYKIGLPHALELPAGDAADFAQLLADYELLQPFAQLGRDTYTLSEEEKAANKLLRWKDQKVPTGKILGLVNIGWRRGPAQDSGCIWTFEKPQDSNKALELTLDPGIIVGLIDEYPEQTLGEITLGTTTRWGNNDDLQNFAALDAIAASELIRDMERLRS